jgi:cytochrome c oxidase assembly protein subunit 15
MNASYNAKVLTIKKLVLLSILLALVVIGLGAYTRLTHAGLGCPDWPTCYGLLDVPETSQQIKAAEQAFPSSRVEPAKAWNEMIHRYFAGSLGLLIAAITFLSVMLRFSNERSHHLTNGDANIDDNNTPLFLPLLILVVVIFQAALGMWSVTLKLMPVVVMGHLLGGFTTLCLLYLLYLRLNTYLSEWPNIHSTGNGNYKAIFTQKTPRMYSRLGLLGMVILTGQIALGGWTSSNYAALTCTELPICQGNWSSQLSFTKAFDLIPKSDIPNPDVSNNGAKIETNTSTIKNYEFGHLAHNERLTIHVTHRIGAMVTTLFLSVFIFILLFKGKNRTITKSVIALTVLLVTQISLGISNIWFALPLTVAVAHNVIAACLMLSLIKVNYQLKLND